MTETIRAYGALFQNIAAQISSVDAPFLIGIAGPPATGKSTLAERLVADLEAAGVDARFCPMDGFHLTNAQLDQCDLRDVKGRIDTFDADAFASSVRRLKGGEAFWWPIYSRQKHEPITEGTHISGSESAYVVEGNYVLTKDERWCAAGKQFDLRIFIDAPDEVLRDRLLERHRRSGRSVRDALEKIGRTDMPNAQIIRNGRMTEDILFCDRADD